MKRLAVCFVLLFAMATIGVYGAHEPYPRRFNGRWVCGITGYEFEIHQQSWHASGESGSLAIEVWRGDDIRHYYGTFRAFPNSLSAYLSFGVIYFDARTTCGRYTIRERFSYRWVSDSQGLRRNLGIALGSETTVYHVIIPWYL